jgi:hypothetical protein
LTESQLEKDADSMMTRECILMRLPHLSIDVELIELDKGVPYPWYALLIVRTDPGNVLQLGSALQ